MLPDLQACLLCDDVRQERNGKFILIGLFDVVGSATFPFVYPRMFVVTRWCSGEGAFHQRTRILAPDQTTVVMEGQPIPFHLPNPQATATNVEVFVNKMIQTEGPHWVEVLLDGDLKIRFPLLVQRISQPPSPGLA